MVSHDYDSIVHPEIPADEVETGRRPPSRAFGWALISVPEMDGLKDLAFLMTAPSDEDGKSVRGARGHRRRDGEEGYLPELAIVTIKVNGNGTSMEMTNGLGGGLQKRIPHGRIN